MQGYSLIELLVCIAIMSMLSLKSTVYLGQQQRSSQLTMAAERVYTILNQAKALSITYNCELWLHLEGLPDLVGNGDWQLLLTDSSELHNTTQTQIFSQQSELFKGIVVRSNYSNQRIKFDPVSGMVRTSGTLTLLNNEGQIEIKTHSASGRVVICARQATWSGLGQCP